MRNFLAHTVRIGECSDALVSAKEMLVAEGPIYNATVYAAGKKEVIDLEDPSVLPLDYWQYLADGGSAIISLEAARAAFAAGYPLDNLWAPVHPYLFEDQIWYLELVPAISVI
jgi:hypothetical protein